MNNTDINIIITRDGHYDRYMNLQFKTSQLISRQKKTLQSLLEATATSIDDFFTQH